VKSPCFCAARRKAWAACLTSRTNHSGTEQRSQRQAVSCPYCVNGPPAVDQLSPDLHTDHFDVDADQAVEDSEVHRRACACSGVPRGRAATRGLCSEPKPPSESLKSPTCTAAWAIRNGGSSIGAARPSPAIERASTRRSRESYTSPPLHG
jgi:hypothetical protein